MSKPVWLVTGTSSGFGLSLVKELIAQDYKVAGTSRNYDRLVEAVGLEKSANFLPLQVDITNEENIISAIKEVVSYFGTIDVLVNNAGHGFRGTVEETTTDDARQLFEDNFFSAHAFIRHVLPIMREKRNGYIFNVGSIATNVPAPLSPFYAASKAALTAMTEALAREVQSFGIKVVPIVPGPFQTKFHDPTHTVLKENTIPDYKEVYLLRKEMEKQPSQKGDPDRAAKVIIEISHLEDVPKFLFIGSESIKRVAPKLKDIEQELEKWEPYTNSCDLPK